MRTIFIDSGLDRHLVEKIEKGNIYSNIQESLPTQKVEAKTLYRALRKGESLLNGFKMPAPKHEELRRALEVISEAVERQEKKREEPLISEKELIEALDYLTEIAREQKG